MSPQTRPSDSDSGELRLHLVSSLPGKFQAVPAVVWLEALPGTPILPFPLQGHYTLLQKNRTFVPHLQVVPVGAVIQFPNADPFFHNVFSLFDGKRFDLGLYEAGSTKAVTFSRAGVSYIFCNIHPEMSAVIVTLSTPYFEVSPADGSITLHAVPPGTYEMGVWAEGSSAQDLNALSRRVVVTASQKDLGEIDVTVDTHVPAHKNKFGEDYQDPKDSLY
jgi:hypothetical protein